jgi:hypothetical protein
VSSHSFAFSASRLLKFKYKSSILIQLGYLDVTVQEKLRSGWPGPFVNVEGCVVISHSFAFSASRRLKFSHNSILPCTAFPSTLVSMLELSPPLPVLLLLRVRGLSRLNTRAILLHRTLYASSRRKNLILQLCEYCRSSYELTLSCF